MASFHYKEVFIGGEPIAGWRLVVGVDGAAADRLRAWILMSIARFERFFRLAAGLDIDTDDLRRYSDFVHKKTYDLMLRAEANAKANGRDVIETFDLPITKGLQESIHAYRKIDEELQLEPVLQGLTQLPPLDLACGEEAEGKLPGIVGGLSYALARSFKIVNPALKNPQSGHWETVFRLFDLLI